ncbi:hypothetical protein D1872_208910 [compost metagenome]
MVYRTVVHMNANPISRRNISEVRVRLTVRRKFSRKCLRTYLGNSPHFFFILKNIDIRCQFIPFFSRIKCNDSFCFGKQRKGKKKKQEKYNHIHCFSHCFNSFLPYGSIFILSLLLVFPFLLLLNNPIVFYILYNDLMNKK